MKRKSQSDKCIMISDSSDEDDDVYTNAAARLKALKAKKPVETITPDVEEEVAPVVKVIQEDDVSTMLIMDHPTITSQFSNYENESEFRRSSRRRNIMAMNLPSVTINLDVSTPSPSADNNVENILEIIDSDSEISNSTDQNYLMDVKVRWRSRDIERVKLGMNEKFGKVFQHFASLKNVPENQILLTRRDIPINHYDTPASINLEIIDILEGGIVDTSFATNTDDGEPKCKIKVQSSSSTRHFLTYDLGKSQPFEKLYEYCSKEKNILASKIKLYFDGELVSTSDTPDSLDLDDEACFDLQIIE